jgi:hypothetical protein
MLYVAEQVLSWGERTGRYECLPNGRYALKSRNDGA